MVTVTGVLVSSMFIDIITLVIARSGKYLKIFYAHLFTPLIRLYESDIVFFRTLKRIYKKLM